MVLLWCFLLLPTLCNCLTRNSVWEDFSNYPSTGSLHEKWLLSKATTSSSKQKYPAKWGLGVPYKLPGLPNDKQTFLQLRSKDAFAFIGTIFDTPIIVDEVLVIQYEVKLQDELVCGGAFLKLFSGADEAFFRHYDSTRAIHDNLQLVFGPDRCLPKSDNIILNIMGGKQHTQKQELKKLQMRPPSKLDDKHYKTHLYTLIVNKKTDNFEIRVDGKVVIARNLLNEGLFKPSFTAPKAIPDVNARKPADWDERKKIPYPDAIKPDDWDEDEPFRIPDSEQKKSQEWDENVPKYIYDPRKTKPEWWDEKKDGQWIAPLIVNPSCFKDKGCGKWEPKMILNPKYKRPWKPPMIDNPNYKGRWEPPMVENKIFNERNRPIKLDKPINAVAFEFFSGSKDLLLGNLYIGTDIAEAEDLGNKTYIPKRVKEDQMFDEQVRSRINLKEPQVPNYVEEIGSENIFDIFFDRLWEYMEPSIIIGVIILVVTIACSRKK